MSCPMALFNVNNHIWITTSIYVIVSSKTYRSLSTNLSGTEKVYPKYSCKVAWNQCCQVCLWSLHTNQLPPFAWIFSPRILSHLFIPVPYSLYLRLRSTSLSIVKQGVAQIYCYWITILAKGHLHILLYQPS